METISEIMDNLDYESQYLVDIQKEINTIKDKILVNREIIDTNKKFSSKDSISELIASTENENENLRNTLLPLEHSMMTERFKVGKTFNLIMGLVKKNVDFYIDNRTEINKDSRQSLVEMITEASEKLTELNHFLSFENLSPLAVEKCDILTSERSEKEVNKKIIILSAYKKGSKNGFSYKEMLIRYKSLVFGLAEEHKNDAKKIIDVLEFENGCLFKQDYAGEDIEKKFKILCYAAYSKDSPFSQHTTPYLRFMLDSSEEWGTTKGLNLKDSIFEFISYITVETLLELCPKQLGGNIKISEQEFEEKVSQKIYTLVEKGKKYYVAITGGIERIETTLNQILELTGLDSSFNLEIVYP